MDEFNDMPMNNTFTVEQKESIKIIKNTKGYQYEVKILSTDITRLKQITDEIEKNYQMKGGNENGRTNKD